MDSAPLDIEDRAACERYLVATGHAQAGDVVEHKLLAGGVSCATVLVAFADGRRWVLKQALAKLRVKADWFSDPNRIHREALGMRVLGELAPPGSIPKLIFDDAAHHVIGMEAVPEPHENWKTMLLAGNLDDKLAKRFGDLLGTIHRESWRQRAEYQHLFEDRSYFESLRIEPYYKYSALQEPRAASFLNDLIKETRSHLDALVHGDFSPKNVLIYQRSPVLLDHEVCHWGDPAFDVGFAVSHFIGKGLAHTTVEQWTPEDGVQYRVSPPPVSQLIRPFWEHYRSTLGTTDWNKGYEQRCIRHSIACILARAVGRSPFEYVDPDVRCLQQRAAVSLISRLPESVSGIDGSFYLTLFFDW